MVNTSLIGKTYPPLQMDVEKQRLRFFAKATGQTDPVYFDEEAAKAAGHPTLLAPPTFLTTVPVESRTPFQFLDELNIDLARVLHGGQSYSYHVPVYAGDRITLKRKIKDVYHRRGSNVQFVVLKETYTNQHDQLVASSTITLVVKEVP